MGNQIWVVVTTIGTFKEGQRMATEAVKENFCACAQLDREITSLYVWEGALQETVETRVQFKVSSTGKPALLQWLREKHPYDVPEILAWPVESGHDSYTKWVEDV